MAGSGTDPLPTHNSVSEKQLHHSLWHLLPPQPRKKAWEVKVQRLRNLLRSPDVQDVVASLVITLSQLHTAAQSELPAPSRKECFLTWETVQTAVLL